MRILLVGLVLIVAWASAIAMPNTNMEAESRAILDDKYTEIYNAFLSGVLYGHTEMRPEEYERVTSDAERYKPIFRYDTQAHANCFPDWATSSNNGVCRGILNPDAPIYYQTTICSGFTVYTYWHWYGWQNNCCCGQGSHDNDWEHISVYVNNDRTDHVVFHQHAGHYTRARGTFEIVGERPVVYVGKISHGSYHIYCDGKGLPSTHVTYCPGGCGYWDDFRNPGYTWSTGVLTDLKPGQIIDGIERPDRLICTSDIGTCVGASIRVLWTSGCWQNEP